MTIAPNDFVHLHTHSEFSLLDGLGRITDLVDTSVKHGFDSLAVTDHGALYGSVAFYQAATKAGIKPIIGVETYVARRAMTDRDPRADSQPFHLILLATDLVGYRNLCRLITDAHIDGFYYKPRIDREHLARYSEGLVGLSACLGGEIPKALEAEDWDLARQVAGDYRDILGKDRFFLELQDHGMPEQHRLNEQLLRLAPEVGLPLVVTNDLHYVHREQHEAHDVLLCVGTGNNLDTPNRMKFDTRDFFLKTAAEMAALFPDQPEALRNTRRIADMCDLALPLGELRIPHFPVPDGETVETWLRKECEAGLVRRYGAITPELQKRLDYELGVIISMGYAGYFLIVADFVRFAREQGIATTCRGSAPGSIVTYTLGITPVDPIDYGLPFERFLNPDRVTMPDIDVDFEDERRDEVINYVSRKYGQDHVAQIITFGTMLARAAIRDVGRVHGHGLRRGRPHRQGRPEPAGHQARRGARAVAPAQGDARHRHPGRAADRVRPPARGRRAQRLDARRGRRHQPRAADRAHAAPAGDQLRRADDPVRDARHRGPRPAQVRLPGPVQPHDPAQGGRPHPRQPRRSRSTSRPSRSTTRRRSTSSRRARRPACSSSSPRACGATSASSSRRRCSTSPPWSRSTARARWTTSRPTSVASTARRRSTYLHPLLEPYLEKTYGIFVYQEDIMSAAVALGGFTGPEADTLGYAIRKKKSSVLRAQKEKFVTQAAGRGVEPKVIDAVFKAFEPFERYGFNKAHATCYGLIAYQTAYLKANYTVEYMTSVLTAFRDNAEKVAAAVVECRRLGIEVRPPDVHRSGLGFTVEGDSIRFGLLAVKNVGEGAIESIIEARESGGEFRSLTDFCSRVDLRLTNRKVLESLAKVGRAQRCSGTPRSSCSGSTTRSPPGRRRSATGSRARRRCSTWPATTRSILERPLPVTPETPVRERLRWEKELLGLYLSDHPMGEVAERVGQFVTAYSGDLKDESLDGQRVVIGGIVTGSRTIITKSKSTMAVVTLEDLQGTRRGRGLPADLRADARAVARGRDPAGRGSGRPPGRGGVAARGRGVGLGRGGGARRRGVRARGRGARPARRRTPRRAGRRQRLGLRQRQRVRRRRRPSGAGRGGAGDGDGRAIGRCRGVAGPRLADARRRRRTCPRSPRPSRSRRTRSRRTSRRRRWPAGWRRPRSRRSPTSSATSPRRPPRPPASRSTPRPGAVLNVRFARDAGSDRVVSAMQAFKAVLRERPGGTRVVVHVPAPGGSALPMELRGVAYDAELLAEVRRRVGEGVIDISLG